MSGSDGHIEQTLQRATDAVMSHVHAAGLTCSAAKLALLLLPPSDRRRCKTPYSTITVHANSTPNPVVCVSAIPHVCSPVSMRGVKAYENAVCSGLPTRWSSPTSRTDFLIHTALGLAPKASPNHRLHLGVHNSLDEMIEAHRSFRCNAFTVRRSVATFFTPSATAPLHTLQIWSHYPMLLERRSLSSSCLRICSQATTTLATKPVPPCFEQSTLTTRPSPTWMRPHTIHAGTPL
ncbi:hypothetical protein HPB52_016990 [Rhipicephalus sanguineus]|uniref:Uncharacterized protein n=1 Tax=Rhipicephalus sanguineus TaxID=34632 RepID=A0A9D4PJY1_RHISA|nr:hypothetical protein HPB52_016990 [Rhipicephalus sanguineus]